MAWSDGSTLRASGNSFATPHISGICALIRSKHPELTPPEVKTLLGLTATNAEDGRMSGDRAAIAAGLLPGDDLHRSLLRSIVDVARAIFRARAASVFLLDGEADELVFEAVSGEGEESLVGRRFPSSTGIAGWVLVTGQSLVLDDVSADPRFASQAAESTGYIPKAIMAVPLVSGERTLGVLEVLDRPSGERFTMEEADLLGHVRDPGRRRARPAPAVTVCARGS